MEHRNGSRRVSVVKVALATLLTGLVLMVGGPAQALDTSVTATSIVGAQAAIGKVLVAQGQAAAVGTVNADLGPKLVRSVAKTVLTGTRTSVTTAVAGATPNIRIIINCDISYPPLSIRCTIIIRSA